jgi:hypothetical protein
MRYPVEAVWSGGRVTACHWRGHPRFHSSMGVVVADEAGITVAVGEFHFQAYEDGTGGQVCTSSASVNVPDRPFYSVTVGGVPSVFSASDLAAANWSVHV